jgi:hypothetical protein
MMYWSTSMFGDTLWVFRIDGRVICFDDADVRNLTVTPRQLLLAAFTRPSQCTPFTK